jgi:hypothetical protein
MIFGFLIKFGRLMKGKSKRKEVAMDSKNLAKNGKKLAL